MTGIDQKEALNLIDADISWRDLKQRVKAVMSLRKDKVISFTRNVFIPITTVCRNRCKYCSFRREEVTLAESLMPPEEIYLLLEKAAQEGYREALLVLGERPAEVRPEINVLLQSWGYANLVDYLYKISLAAIKTGLLPHTNAGIMCRQELSRLRAVNASMGLMLESTSLRLCQKNGPHEFSPGKNPRLRLEHIKTAGELGIPLTTGILVGIGESPQERIDSLFAIRDLHRTYGHIQEVIIQNFCPKENTPMSRIPEPLLDDMLKIVAIARLVFGPAMNIQVPPNLNSDVYYLFVEAGVNDWGGISQQTKDMINPEKPWPTFSELKRETISKGYQLKERLAVYPRSIKTKYLHPLLKKLIIELATPEGYLKEGI